MSNKLFTLWLALGVTLALGGTGSAPRGRGTIVPGD